jgi:hypothetical protein
MAGLGAAAVASADAVWGNGVNRRRGHVTDRRVWLLRGGGTPRDRITSGNGSPSGRQDGSFSWTWISRAGDDSETESYLSDDPEAPMDAIACWGFAGGR